MITFHQKNVAAFAGAHRSFDLAQPFVQVRISGTSETVISEDDLDEFLHRRRLISASYYRKTGRA